MPELSNSRYTRLLLAIWLVSAILLVIAGRGAIAGWQMGDPDDQLRLVQIRDWLAGQSWWDVTQYRMNPPDGGPMHWSRLVDLPIALVIVALTPFFGQPSAELAAAVAIPLLTYGIVLWLLAAISTKLGGRWAGIVAAVSLFGILPATIQLAPMRIDHHGWQLVAFLAATLALLDRNRPVRAAIIIGVACALWMEISIEGLPFAALFLGILGVRWLGSDRAAQLPWASAALALTTGTLYFATEGLAATNYCDSLSPVHVAALLAAASVVCLAHWATIRLNGNRRIIARLFAGAVAASAAISALLLLAPQCAGDAFANLDPLVRQYWFNRTPEGLPLWQHKPSAIVQELAGFAAGCIGLIALWRAGTKLPAQDRLAMTLLFAGSAIVAATVARAAIYPLCLAALLAAPLVVRLFARSNGAASITRRMALRIAAVALIMPGVLGTHVARALPSKAETPDPAETQAEAEFVALARQCQSAEAIGLLNRLPPSQLMAGLDASPGLLQFTHHKVVATGHHRNQLAMRDVIRGYTMSPEVMQQILTERGVDYLVACDGSFELRIYAENAPDGFWAQVKQGKSFDWLVRQPDIGPYHIWRVGQGATAS